jgi:hypothetical protein
MVALGRSFKRVHGKFANINVSLVDLLYHLLRVVLEEYFKINFV